MRRFPKTANMFSQIDCLKHNHIIGIQDTATDPGRFLIKELVARLKDSEIHLFSFDCDSNRTRDELGDYQKSVTFHDCLPQLAPECKAVDELQKFLSSANDRRCSSNNLLIIMDSVSTLFLQKPLADVLRTLRELLKHSSRSGDRVRTQIVAILHEDALPTSKRIMAHMKILCRVWIRVRSPKVDVSFRKKSGGKLSVATYKYEGDVNGRLFWHQLHDEDASSRQESNEGPVSTFKLSLSESEKKARDAVKLPYERHDSGDEPTSEAAIIYEPDEYDDWDEEDPDNDLEFT